MFRSDRDALADKVDELRAENERLRAQNEAMRTDLLAQRAREPSAVATTNVYRGGHGQLGHGEQDALSRHALTAFPVWAAAILHVVTLGVWSFIHFNLMHDRLPKAQHDDPSAAKAIGFHFIPYYNYYWVFWSGLRLVDRVNLQRHLRGQPDAVPRWVVILACVSSIIPYLQFITGPLAWLFVAIYLQGSVNGIVAHDEASARPVEQVAPAPAVRIPAVRDLPLPDDVAAQAAAEEEAARADEALYRQRQ